MEIYFLKSAACLAVLMLFYKLLLEKESMHVFKRFYLLFSVCIALIIPFITFTTYIEPSVEIFNPVIISSEAVAENDSLAEYIPLVLLGIYISGVFFFSIKFIRNLGELVSRIRKNPKIKQNCFTNVLLNELIPPHTFFSFIFFNKKKYLHKEIPQDVIIHEEAHARQKHSVDVIFVELLQIIFWFNPLIYLVKNAIKLNHEFLADRAVIRQGISTAGYQQTLLSYSSGDLQSDLVNAINYSSIKKRFKVMKTKTSKTAAWTRSLLVLPLLAVLVYGFSTNEVLVQPQDQNQNETEANSEIIISEDINVKIFNNGEITVNHQTVKLDGLEERLERINNHLSIEERKELTSANVKVEPGVKMGIITDVKMLLIKYGVRRIEVSESDISSPDRKSNDWLKEELDKMKDLKVNYIHQEIVTPAMIAEYNKLAAPHNSQPKGEAIIKKKDYERMQYIYGLMTPDQKKKAEAFPVPAPPPPPPAPQEKMVKDSKTPLPPPPPAPNNEVKNFPSPPSSLPAPAPPPPNSNTVEYINELAKRGAVFYIGPHKYSQDEVITMVKKSTNKVSIDVSEYPIIRIGGC